MNQKQTAYIAGPMSNHPAYNFPAFDAARDDIRSRGFDVISPADLDREAGFDPDTCKVDKEFLDAAMQRDLDAIMRVDFMVMLPGWRDSTGARAEYALARWRHIPVLDWPSMEPTQGVLPAPVAAVTPSEDPKADAGAKKCPMHLLAPVALRDTAWVHKLGADRYGPWNWRKTGVCLPTYIGAIMRHLMLIHEGEWIDPESGRPHAAHIAASCNIIMDADAHGKLTQKTPPA